MDNSFYIIGIDPGNNLGISILTINSDNFKIINIEPITIILDNFINLNLENKLISKLTYLENIILYYIETYSPLAICIESAFMNSKYPTAVMALSQYVGIIEMTITKYNNFIKIFKYAPKYIKSNIYTGDANKNDMKEELFKIKEIKKFIFNKNLTEHSIDATAIAYTGLLDIRTYPMLLLSY